MTNKALLQEFCKNTVSAPRLNRVSLCHTVFFALLCAEASCSNVCLLTRCKSLFQNKHRKGVVVRNIVARSWGLFKKIYSHISFFFYIFSLFYSRCLFLHCQLSPGCTKNVLLRKAATWWVTHETTGHFVTNCPLQQNIKAHFTHAHFTHSLFKIE